MKKVIMLAMALMLVAGTVSAGPVAYIGLYADAGHAVKEFINPGGFNMFTLWTWVLPSDNGAMCAEYQIVPPTTSGLIIQAAEVNPDVTVSMGSAIGAPGASVCFGACQTDWFWTFRVPIYSTDTVPGFFVLAPHVDAGGPQVANCILPDYPIEPATPFTKFGLNQDGVVATGTASWGAVKSLINN
ncbi:MAG: hypothetical protein KAV42_03890 [Candidatus Krumholzibacteria bacterium]|nr:hypothetical protein [Candidatus Krumholzibacteria bacterium]